VSDLTDELIADARERMAKSVEAIRGEFGTVRTGTGEPRPPRSRQRRLLRRPDPLKQLATVSAPEARLLSVQPYDKNSIKTIEKAILESDVGLTPNNDGSIIRLQIPELTEERRKELVKVVHGICEKGRVAVRNHRRDIMHDLRELKGEGEVGSDEEHRAEQELQKLTDEKVSELDALLKNKEAEILEV
jgi:ribosome recycling factor